MTQICMRFIGTANTLSAHIEAEAVAANGIPYRIVCVGSDANVLHNRMQSKCAKQIFDLKNDFSVFAFTLLWFSVVLFPSSSTAVSSFQFILIVFDGVSLSLASLQTALPLWSLLLFVCLFYSIEKANSKYLMWVLIPLVYWWASVCSCLFLCDAYRWTEDWISFSEFCAFWLMGQPYG